VIKEWIVPKQKTEVRLIVGMRKKEIEGRTQRGLYTQYELIESI